MSRVKFCSALFVVAATIILAATFAAAQATTGSIYGQLTDPSAAVVVDASVTAVNQQTGVTYAGRSDAQGNYAVFGLPPGVYDVTVRRDGFDAASIKSIRIGIDQKQLLNFQMKVGAVTETVTITAAPTMLQTESSETGEVIQSHDILELPLLGRHFYDLTALTAGVSGGSGNTNTFNFSVNGQREYANSIQIDGIESTTNRTQDITATPGVDSIEEFKVATSNYDAEFGRSAGGEVSIQTKSGSNRWHGDAYEFFRPNFTAAKQYSFFGTHIPPSVLKQHNYGGTLGGPIIKGKTFFFISYEGTKSSYASDGVFQTPPMNQIKVLSDGSVDLSGLIDPLAGTPNVPAGQVIPIFDPAVSFSSYGGVAQQFPGNIIPASEVSKAGLNTLLNFFAQPNLPGTDNGWFNNFQFHYPNLYHQKQADARLDHNFSDKDHLSFVFHYNDSQSLTDNIYYGHTVVPGADDTDFANNQVSGAQEYSISESHLFSTRLMNEVRFGYTRYYLDQYSLLSGHDYSTQYGMGNIAVPGIAATDAYPYIDLYSGYFTGGSSYKPLLLQDHNVQISDNVILSGVGRHEFKFGGDFRRLNSYPYFTIFPTGFQYYGAYFSPSTSDPTFGYFNPHAWFPNGGADIADLLVGLPFVTDIGLQLTNPHTQSWEMHFYGQDTYKVNSRLTLNYGLRYEFQAPYTDAHNFSSNFDPTATNQPGEPLGAILVAGVGSNSRSLINSRWNDFAPRVGFAYQFAPKTVLRGGFGIFYSPENDGKEDLLARNYPFSNLSSYEDYYYFGPPSYQLDTGIARSATVPFKGIAQIDPANIPSGTLLTTYYVNPKMKTGYSEQYNLALQRELGSDFTIEAAFIGNKSRHLSYEIGDINFDYAAQSEGFINPKLGKIQGLTDLGWGQYDALQLKLTKRVSHNLNFLASYTYSHSLDNGPAPFNLGVNSNYPQNPYDLNAEIASSDNDIRHSFVFSGLYHLPIGRGQKFFGSVGRVPDMILGGWQINGIFFMHTGTPVNVVRGAPLTTCPGVRPNLVGDPTIPRSDRTLTKYFNTSAFDSTNLTGCEPGDAGRNLVSGPGYINLDSSIFKEFDIHEGIKLQTRFEFFNTLNTPHFQNPDGVESDGTFGQIPARVANNMRIMQVAAKIIF
jgi:Carboxypeptidase regulatory-like domain